MILTVYEDPIFGQVVFTLFRAVTQDRLNRAYQSVAELLYQELTQADHEIAQATSTLWLERLHFRINMALSIRPSKFYPMMI